MGTKQKVMESPSSSSGSRRRIPSLSWFRFTSVVIFLVALDSLVCVGLWLGGGTSSYLEHSVKDFSFTHSTFDLAVVAVARGFVLIPCLYYLERYSLLAVSSKSRSRRVSAKKFSRICRAGVFLLPAVSILYIVVKGSFIIHQLSNGNWEHVDADMRMHITYRILCIASLIFSLFEIAIGVASWYFLGRLVRVQQMQLLINAEEGNEEEEEEEGKKKADLKRLILLAKPVSPPLSLSLILLHVNVL